MIHADFARSLSLLRQEKGISQETLARDLGVSKSTIGLYETGDTLPDAKTLRDLVQDPILQSVLKEYPYWRTPWQQRILSFFLRYKKGKIA